MFTFLLLCRTISLELRLRNRADTVEFEYVCISTISISFVLMSICHKWKQNETKLLLMNNRKQTISNRVSPIQHKPNTFSVCVNVCVVHFIATTMHFYLHVYLLQQRQIFSQITFNKHQALGILATSKHHKRKERKTSVKEERKKKSIGKNGYVLLS